MKITATRSLLVGMVSLAASAAALAQDQPPPGPAFETFSTFVGDINGDGISDYAVSDPFNGASGTVTLRCGATGDALIEFPSPAGELNFGMSLAPTCDMDNDGLPDLAIASILPEPVEDERGVVHIYSSATGKQIGYIEELDSANIKPDDVVVLGDLDNNKQVDETDLMLWLLSMSENETVTDPEKLDVNEDGFADANDVTELFERLGYVSDQNCSLAFVNFIVASSTMIDDTSWEGTQVAAGGAPAQAGVVGCIWCLIKCGKHLKKAADCGEQYREHIRTVCEPFADQGKYFEYSQCLDDARLNFLPNCLQDVANAAGSCAKCVTKCGPKPSASAN